MSGEFVALLIGTALAVSAVAFVLYPLFFGDRTDRKRQRPATSEAESAIVTLREIEFDRATGKLSDADYSELRRTYAERALAEMRETERVAPSVGNLDDVEARVLAYRKAHRECRTCGLRPEDDAIYCSTCGAFLDETCPACTAAVPESAATFCSHCGVNLPRAVASA